MKAVLILAVLAVAVSGALLPDFAKIQATMQTSVPAARRQFIQEVDQWTGSRTPFVVQAALSAACAKAIHNLAWEADNSTGCVHATGVQELSLLTQAKLVTHCGTTGCAKKLSDELAKVKSDCTAADVEEMRSRFDFTNAIQLAKLLAETVCTTKIDTNYCFAGYAALQNAGGFEGFQKQEDLDKNCAPCNLALVKALASAADVSAVEIGGMIDLFCTKLDGKYCILVLGTIGDKLGASGGDFSVLCDPCVIEFVRAAVVVAGSGNSFAQGLAEAFDTFVTMIKGFCVKDENGNYCASRLQAVMDLGPQLDQYCPATPKPSEPCAGQCLGLVNEMHNRLGCCFASIFGAIGAISGGSQGGPSHSVHLKTYSMPSLASPTFRVMDANVSNPSDVKDWLEQKCGQNMGNGCAGTRIKAKLFVKNLLYAYYKEHKADIDLKVKLDIAKYFHLDADAVTVTGAADSTGSKRLAVQAVTAGVTFNYEIVPETSAQGATIQNQIATGAAQIDTPSLSTLPLDSRQDPQQSVTTDADAAKTSVTIERTSGAATFGASVSSVLAVLVAALYLKF